MTENKRFTWEYSHHDSTGEIIDWIRNECLMTDYLQKYELEEWCQELNKIVDENNQLRKENEQLKDFIKKLGDDTGRIVLMNGYGYHISKVINDD